jgi:tetratricopeptide (TPR) repeat protein
VLLRTLGGLNLEGASLTRPKPLLMLAYVCIEGPVTRRELSDVFFRDADDARDSLSTALRHLRRAGAVERLPDERVAALVDCDATGLLRDFDAYRYEAVLHAYEGPFLDGIDVSLGLDLETWLFTTREAIARRVRVAALHRARAQIAEGQLDEARRLAALAVHLRGAPELEMDELAAALPVLERLNLPEAAQVRELAESYGVDWSVRGPGVPSARGSRPCRAATPPSSAARRTAGPGGPPARADTRLLTLFGLGGVGKTRLALRLAERLAAHGSERYPDGVAVVSLESVDRPSEVVPTIAAGLALPATAGASAADLGDALESWRALLVLDNFERVTAPRPTSRSSSSAAPTSSSSSPAGLGWASRASGPSSSAGSLRRTPERTEERRPTLPSSSSSGRRAWASRLEATVRDAEAIEALCATLEGYPLGIELAAALARALSVDEIHAGLRRDLAVLDHGPADAPPRHRGVRAVLEPSWSLLGPRERDAVVRLGVFRTAFAFDAAAAVAGLSLPSLLRLVDHAVVRSEGSGRGRFGFHPVMLAFVRERGGAAEREAAEAAHRSFFAERLALDGKRVATEPREVLDRLASELPDVMHAVRGHLATGDVARAIDMMLALVVDADFLQARGGGPELIALARTAAAAAEARGDLGAAEPLWTKVANAVRVLLDDPVEAAGLYGRALELAERGDDVPRQVMLHAILGAVLDARSPDAAEAHMAAARDLADAADDDLLRCEVLHRWGYVACVRRDWARARVLNAEAVEIADRLWSAGGVPSARVPSLLFHSLHNLGVAEEGLGDVAASVPHRARALEVAIARGQSLWIANARHDLAIAHRALDDLDAARRHATEALAPLRSAGCGQEPRCRRGAAARVAGGGERLTLRSRAEAHDRGAAHPSGSAGATSRGACEHGTQPPTSPLLRRARRRAGGRRREPGGRRPGERGGVAHLRRLRAHVAGRTRPGCQDRRRR